MKLTKTKLKQIIKEEIKALLSEYNWAIGNKVEKDGFGIGTVDIARKGEETVHVVWENPPEGKPRSGSYHRGELSPVGKEKGIGTRAHPELGHEGYGVPDWLQEGK